MTRLIDRNVTLRPLGDLRPSVGRSRRSVAPTRPVHRSSLVAVLIAAMLAVSAVSVAERVEQNLTTTVDTAADSPATDVAPTVDEPLLSAALPSGPMAVTLLGGTASIMTGTDAPAIELATASIGDLDLRGAADGVVIAQADDQVSYDWGEVTEWYRRASDGIEHGYTVASPVSSTDDLTVTVAVGQGSPRLVDDQTVAIAREGADTIWYRGLFAFDAAGVDLPASMAVVDGGIELRIDTAGAEYPITIDPIISTYQLIRAEAGPASLAIDQVADSGRIGTGGGGEKVSACPAGTVLTGLIAYQTSRDGNWLRSAIPQCRQVELVGGVVGLTGDVVTGPEFGVRVGPSPLALPLDTPVSGNCEPGSAVTGLSGNAGSLVDNVVLSCNVVNPDGTVGAAGAPVGPFGRIRGQRSRSRVVCDIVRERAAGPKAGDDLDAIGLQCGRISVGTNLADDELGWAVDIDGDRMVASAPFADVGGVAGAGKVYVYNRDVDGLWAQTAEIVSPAPEAGGGFGDSLALSGDLVAIGESDRLGDHAEPGRVWVFGADGLDWFPQGAPISADVAPDSFGASLAWLGATLVIGAPDLPRPRRRVLDRVDCGRVERTLAARCHFRNQPRAGPRRPARLFRRRQFVRIRLLHRGRRAR